MVTQETATNGIPGGGAKTYAPALPSYQVSELDVLRIQNAQLQAQLAHEKAARAQQQAEALIDAICQQYLGGVPSAGYGLDLATGLLSPQGVPPDAPH